MTSMKLQITAILCLLFGGSSFSTLHARPLAEIQTSREIRFCLAGSAHEFYRKNALAFTEFLGNDIQPVFIRLNKWNDQFVNDKNIVAQDEEYTPEPLASGKCDVYPNDLVRVGWREKKMAFVLLFISRNTIIVSKNSHDKIPGQAYLAGKTAAIMEGTSYQTWIEEQNRGRFKDNPIQMIFMPQKDALKAAESGKVDFAVIGADGALWAARSFAPDIHVAFPVGEINEYGWCFRKQDTSLQEAVRQFFSTQKSSYNSPLNQNWREHTGLTLGEFTLFVTSTPIPTDNQARPR